jgi:DNA polymerase I-like protein with 3'-5' exonuclease and polymerase domains
MNLPNLSQARLLSIDVETCDPGLVDRGPSTFRGGGYICGVSLATDDGFCEYLPVRHEGGGNLDRDLVYRWLKDQLGRAGQPKLGANIGYDLERLRAEGVVAAGPKWDVQIAAALLDENRASYSLESLSRDLLGEGKDETGLLDAALARGVREKDLKGSIHLLSGDEVAPYGRKDVLLPLRLWARQEKEIADQGLRRVFDLEADLVDTLLEMRFKGVRVDLERAERTAEELDVRKVRLEKSLAVIAGGEVDYWSNKRLAETCDRLGIKYPSTAKGNPSLAAEWLSTQEHPFLRQVAEARLLDRAGSVFIRSKIIGEAVSGRVHCQLHSVRGERGGTRTGRLSCSNPNLQQVPARNEGLSRLIRACFVPEPGEEWLSSDWSQVEPRIALHYAETMALPGAAEAAQRYRDDPRTDYHQMTADMATIGRKPAKTINLGLSYGMGKAKLAANLHLSMTEAEDLYKRYHEAMPFIRLLGSRCSLLAEQRGWVKTLLGRRRRFDLFGPARWKDGRAQEPLPRDEAIKRYGPGVKRYFVHKAMSAVVQGTAAELMKLALVALHKAQLTPNLTVHDEVCRSITDRGEARRVKDVMENVYRLRVPLYADVELGPSWGEAKEDVA